jgi:hypothetical protein
MSEEKGNAEDLDFDTSIEEANEYEPIPLTVERMKELLSEKGNMMQMARSGQFGFQLLMMHPVGHVQMAADIIELAEHWVEANESER